MLILSLVGEYVAQTTENTIIILQTLVGYLSTSTPFKPYDSKLTNLQPFALVWSSIICVAMNGNEKVTETPYYLSNKLKIYEPMLLCSQD